MAEDYDKDELREMKRSQLLGILLDIFKENKPTRASLIDQILNYQKGKKVSLDLPPKAKERLASKKPKKSATKAAKKTAKLSGPKVLVPLPKASPQKISREDEALESSEDERKPRISRFVEEKNGSVLSDISWDVLQLPYTRAVDKNIPTDTEKNEKPVCTVGYLDKKLDELVCLTIDEFEEIVFEEPVDIEVPNFLQTPEEAEADENTMVVFRLEPNTPYGSTLRHTLEQIFINLYGHGLIVGRDIGKINYHLQELIDKEDFYVAHHFFEGLVEPEDEFKPYQISLGS